MARMARRRCAVYPVRAISSDDTEARDAFLKLLSERSADKTICPSEAARAIGGEKWCDLMPSIHAAARALAEKGMWNFGKAAHGLGR